MNNDLLEHGLDHGSCLIPCFRLDHVGRHCRARKRLNVTSPRQNEDSGKKG